MHDDEEKSNNDRWFLTYSDMITLLLVLFIVMYTMSTIDNQKFKDIAQQMGYAFNGNQSAAATGENTGIGTGSFNFSGSGNVYKKNLDEVFKVLKANIQKQGYDSSISIEKGDYFLIFRFNDNVLFYPDSSSMRPEGYPILQVIGKALGTLSKQIDHIEIDGHTAKVSGESTSNYFSWQLSADRAIEVLKFLVIKCGLPQDKMSVAGFSHYVPVTGNDTEKERAQNRRVEIKITSIHDTVAVDVATKN